jgi:acetolactate synthase-1/2/3 large subunit
VSERRGSVALALVDVLREFGVDTVFGVPGGAISTVYAALLERPDVRIVTAKHETAAGFMALGYARATSRPGVVLATAGPGITNAITGVASAYYESAPVVLLAGEVPRSSFGRGALQEGSAAGFDAVALFRGFTKLSAQLANPGNATSLFRKALTTAYSGRRGPVFLSLPLDVGAAATKEQPIVGAVQTAFDVDDGAARTAMELLCRARKPLLVVGSGCRDATARRAVRRLAQRVELPVATTTKAKGIFPETDPRYLGVLGFGGHESVIDYLRDGVDVLLAVGTGLNDLATNAWTPLLRGSRAFLQVDIDSAQLGKNYPIDLGLVGPADAVLARMLQYAPEFPLAPRDPAPPLAFQPVPTSARGMLSNVDIVLAMNEVCPADAVVTADVGEHLAPALHYYRTREGGDFITCAGFGSMGSGIHAAIGHQLGAPSRRTYALCGDGGMLMFGGDLVTAVQHRLRTTFVISNDSRYNMVHHGMVDLYGASPDFSTPLVDFAELARSMGATGRVVRTRDELRAGLVLQATGPVVLDVRTDPDVRLRGSQRDAALRQFSDRPPPPEHT